MAWNPSPEVKVARDAAQKLDAEMCVVIYVNRKEQIGYASYGRTKALCDETKKLADHCLESAMDWFAFER